MDSNTQFILINRLLKDPRSLNKMLFNKYGDINEDFNFLYLDALIYSKPCHFFTQYKEYLIWDFVDEFLKRYYTEVESKERLPKISNYYKNYLKFFCNPFFKDFKHNAIIQSFGDNKAEIYYKNNYGNKNKGKVNQGDVNINSLGGSSNEDESNCDKVNMLFDTSVRENIDKNILTKSTLKENSNFFDKTYINKLNDNSCLLPDNFENDNKFFSVKADLLTRRSREDSLLNILNNLGEDCFANMNKKINDRFIDKINKNNSINNKKPIKSLHGKNSTRDKTNTKVVDEVSNSIKNVSGGLIANKYKNDNINKSSKINNKDNIHKHSFSPKNIHFNNKIIFPPKKTNNLIENKNYERLYNVNNISPIAMGNVASNTVNNIYNSDQVELVLKQVPFIGKTNMSNPIDNNSPNSFKNKISYCNLYKANPWTQETGNKESKVNMKNLMSNSNALNNGGMAHYSSNSGLNNQNLIKNLPTGIGISFNPTQKILNPNTSLISPKPKQKFTRINEFQKNKPKQASLNCVSPTDTQRLISTNRKGVHGKSLIVTNQYDNEINFVVNNMLSSTLTPNLNIKNSVNYSVDKKVVIKSNKDTADLNSVKNVDKKSAELEPEQKNENDVNKNNSALNISNKNTKPVKNNAMYTKVNNKRISPQTSRPNSHGKSKRLNNNLHSCEFPSKNDFSGNQKSDVSSTTSIFSNPLLSTQKKTNKNLSKANNFNQTSRNTKINYNALTRQGDNFNSKPISKVKHSRYPNSQELMKNPTINITKNTSTPSKINSYMNFKNKIMNNSQIRLNDLYAFKTVKKSQSIDKNSVNKLNNNNNNTKSSNLASSNANYNTNNKTVSRNKNQSLFKISSNLMNNNKFNNLNNEEKHKNVTSSTEKERENNLITSVERKYTNVNVKSPIIMSFKKGKKVENNKTGDGNNNPKIVNINNILNSINEGIAHKIKSKLQDFVRNQDINKNMIHPDTKDQPIGDKSNRKSIKTTSRIDSESYSKGRSLNKESLFTNNKTDRLNYNTNLVGDTKITENSKPLTKADISSKNDMKLPFRNFDEELLSIRNMFKIKKKEDPNNLEEMPHNLVELQSKLKK